MSQAFSDKLFFCFSQAPEPIDSVPRGSIISVKPSDAFSDKKFVFEIQQKSGTVWFVQASTMVSLNAIQQIRANLNIPERKSNSLSTKAVTANILKEEWVFPG